MVKLEVAHQLEPVVLVELVECPRLREDNESGGQEKEVYLELRTMEISLWNGQCSAC